MLETQNQNPEQGPEKKKKNTKKKGQKKETLCANELVRNGFKVFYKSTTVKRGPFWIGLDFADLFDVIVARRLPRPPYCEWILVSVKNWADRSSFGEERDKIRKWASEYLLIGMKAQLWATKKIKENGRERRAWRIWHIGASKDEDREIIFKEGEVEL